MATKESFKGSPVFSWESREFANAERKPVWYIVFTVTGIVLLAFFIWQRAWTAIVLEVTAVLYFILGSRPNSKKIICSVYNEGIVVGNRTYSFDELKSFWFVFSNLNKIKFKLNGRFKGDVTMPMENADEKAVTQFIKTKIPEELSEGEDIVDKIHRIVGF